MGIMAGQVWGGGEIGRTEGLRERERLGRKRDGNGLLEG